MSLNSCSFIGHLGRDPEIRTTQGGDRCANISLAVSEKWKDRSGNRQERTTWVPVVIWGKLADVAERYLHKGSQVFIRGKFAVRKWQDQSGQDRWTTEIVLNDFASKLVMLGSAPAADASGTKADPGRTAPADLDDEVPF